MYVAKSQMTTQPYENMIRRIHGLLRRQLVDTNTTKKNCSIIKEVRGIGLMIGIELNCQGADIVRKCRKKGLLINCTQKNVLRLMPALNVTKAEIKYIMAILEDYLKN